jgi:hypothetical protein
MIAALRAMSFPFQAGAPPRTPACPHRGRQRARFHLSRRPISRTCNPFRRAESRVALFVCAGADLLAALRAHFKTADQRRYR